MVYVLDRILEGFSGLVLADRHELNLFLAFVIGTCATIYVCLFIYEASFYHRLWFLVLVFGGFLYLITTAGVWNVFPGFKEILGAGVFSLLCLGVLQSISIIMICSFFLMAFSNFLWSGFIDRHRDQTNHLRSVAIWNEKACLMLARVSAICSLTGYFLESAPSSLIGVSILHALWRKRSPLIDLAFLPVIIHAAFYFLFST